MSQDSTGTFCFVLKVVNTLYKCSQVTNVFICSIRMIDERPIDLSKNHFSTAISVLIIEMSVLEDEDEIRQHP